jgi:hypothetical protein
MRLNGFGLRLAWEVQAGLLEATSQPGDTLTPETLDAWIEYLMAIKNSLETIATRLDQLFAMMCALAPQGDWQYVIEARDWFKAEAREASNGELKIVHPSELYALGFELMGTARQPGCRSERQR